MLDASSRRGFLGKLGLLSFSGSMSGDISAEWDLSWIRTIERAKNVAVFDMPSIQDGLILDTATRYLDNCDAVYGAKSGAIAVLNIRTQAVGLALEDTMWRKYALGAQYSVKDPVTDQPAERNRYRAVPADAYPGTGALDDLRARGAIFLVCDFALGHLAGRLANAAGSTEEEVHRELRVSFIPGAIAVPSGIFGMARAQNAGAAMVKM